MFEHRRQPLLPRPAFYLRLLRNAGAALGVIAAALGIGIFGYHEIDGLPWTDSLLNASMILGGMGPVDPLRNTAASSSRRSTRCSAALFLSPSRASFSLQ